MSVMSTTSNSITMNSVKGDSTQSCTHQRSVRVSSCPFLVDKEALYHSHSEELHLRQALDPRNISTPCCSLFE